MRRIELSGDNQRIMEQRCHLNIQACNDKIRRNTTTYINWDKADERLRRSYARDEYKTLFIDHWRVERRRWVLKLRDVRQGVLYE